MQGIPRNDAAWGRRWSSGALASWVVTLGLLWGLAWPHPGQATDTADRTFALPAGPLDRALAQFARQSGSQLLYPPELAQGRQAHAVTGAMSPTQALTRLLAGSGLQATPVSGGVFVLRVQAQTTASRGRAASTPSVVAPEAVAPPQPLRRVLVTGSRIPRVALEATTPVTIIDRAQIESAGFTTLFDLLRYQPGMSGHHVVDAATEAISESLTSLVSTAVVQSASLYGLGPRGTLYLVDGRRVANYALPSTALGGLHDLGAIPLSMVERVEILRGGASAVYGADAVAGVVNIILRRDYRGGEAGALYGMSERGDAETRRVFASAGIPLASGQVSIVADRFSQARLPGTSRHWHTRDRRREGLGDGTTQLGYYRFGGDALMPSAPCARAQDPSDPACRLDRERYRSLRPAVESSALRVHWRQPLDAAGDAEVFAELRGARTDTRMDTAPMTLWNIPVPRDDALHAQADALGHAFYDVGPISSRNRATVVDAAAGTRFRAGAWQLDAELSRSTHRVDNRVRGVVNQGALRSALAAGSYAFDGRANSPATLRGIAPPLDTAGRSTLDAASVRGSGTLGRWRGGVLRAAAGLEVHRDTLDYRPDPYFSDPELAAPLASGDTRGEARRAAAFAEVEVPFGERLWLEAAGRLDRADAGASEFSPRLGIGWRPHDTVLVRASVADAFRAPTLYETLGHPPPDDYYGLDVWVPAAAVAPCATPFADGCILRIGVAANPDLAPERARTRNLGMVWSPRDGLDLALDGFSVLRDDGIAVASAVVDDGIGIESLVRDAAGNATAFVTRFENRARTDIRGVHLDANWTFDPASVRRWSVRLLGHYVTRVRDDSEGAGAVDQAGHLAPRLAANGSLRWQAPAWDASLHLRHFGGYRVHRADRACPTLHAAAGRCRNPSVNLLAFHVAHDIDAAWRISLHIDNLTDRAPANFETLRTGYNGAIDDPVGRSYLMRVSRRF
ncbi:MAG: TonB-dependent receptor [Luteimonas sp.]